MFPPFLPFLRGLAYISPVEMVMIPFVAIGIITTVTFADIAIEQAYHGLVAQYDRYQSEVRSAQFNAWIHSGEAKRLAQSMGPFPRY
jgi:hypothetical protein